MSSLRCRERFLYIHVTTNESLEKAILFLHGVRENIDMTGQWYNKTRNAKLQIKV